MAMKRTTGLVIVCVPMARTTLAARVSPAAGMRLGTHTRSHARDLSLALLVSLWTTGLIPANPAVRIARPAARIGAIVNLAVLMATNSTLRSAHALTERLILVTVAKMKKKL